MWHKLRPIFIKGTLGLLTYWTYLYNFTVIKPILLYNAFSAICTTEMAQVGRKTRTRLSYKVSTMAACALTLASPCRIHIDLILEKYAALLTPNPDTELRCPDSPSHFAVQCTSAHFPFGIPYCLYCKATCISHRHKSSSCCQYVSIMIQT